MESPDSFEGDLPSEHLENASDAVSENERRTSAESSASTWRARRADDASRWVGRGTEIVLARRLVGIGSCGSIGYSYNEQGKATGSVGFKCSCVPFAGSIQEAFVNMPGAIGGRWVHGANVVARLTECIFEVSR